jgi:hypothetical protein
MNSSAQSPITIITLRLRSPTASSSHVLGRARGHHTRYHPHGGGVDGGRHGPRRLCRPSGGFVGRGHSCHDAHDRIHPLVRC